ncbi:hypothetical protein M405DRAFT_821548, partial [Rhizopogon salebrosus TDB-379]
MDGDYPTIPATSVDVEHLFSCGRLPLSRARSRLSSQSTHALLCLGAWNHSNLIKTWNAMCLPIAGV